MNRRLMLGVRMFDYINMSNKKLMNKCVSFSENFETNTFLHIGNVKL